MTKEERDLRMFALDMAVAANRQGSHETIVNAAEKFHEFLSDSKKQQPATP